MDTLTVLSMNSFSKFTSKIWLVAKLLILMTGTLGILVQLDCSTIFSVVMIGSCDKASLPLPLP